MGGKTIKLEAADAMAPLHGPKVFWTNAKRRFESILNSTYAIHFSTGVTVPTFTRHLPSLEVLLHKIWHRFAVAVMGKFAEIFGGRRSTDLKAPRRGLAVADIFWRLARNIKLATVARVVEWRRRNRSRKELMTLSERGLRDFRMTAFDWQREVRKPFWRG